MCCNNFWSKWGPMSAGSECKSQQEKFALPTQQQICSQTNINVATQVSNTYTCNRKQIVLAVKHST